MSTPPNGRIHIKNVPIWLEERKIREHFETFGRVVGVRLPVHDNGKRKHFGFVVFSTPGESCEALEHTIHRIDGCDVRAEVGKPFQKQKKYYEPQCHRHTHPLDLFENFEFRNRKKCVVGGRSASYNFHEGKLGQETKLKQMETDNWNNNKIKPYTQ